MMDDRGLLQTSRPALVPGDASPYTLENSADLTLQICKALGFRRILLAGHADGAILAVITAAKLQFCRQADGLSLLPPSRRQDSSHASLIIRIC